MVDLGFDKHLRVNHGDNEFACGEPHINGIESFWGYAKKRLSKFNGNEKINIAKLNITKAAYTKSYQKYELLGESVVAGW